jgi:hypothetical protein
MIRFRAVDKRFRLRTRSEISVPCDMKRPLKQTHKSPFQTALYLALSLFDLLSSSGVAPRLNDRFQLESMDQVRLEERRESREIHSDGDKKMRSMYIIMMAKGAKLGQVVFRKLQRSRHKVNTICAQVPHPANYRP